MIRRACALARLWLLIGALSSCNELTGVNDLVVAECAPPDERPCSGAAACQGVQVCQGDGTFAESCECSETGVGGLGASGNAGSGNSSAGNGGTGGGLLGQGGEAAAAATVDPFAVCEAAAECGAGYACDGQVCRRLCDAAADCTAPGSQCAPPLTQGENFCTANCDIFSPAEPSEGYQACGEGVHCLPSANLTDATDCFYTRGVTRDGAGCAQDSDCLPGSICVTMPGATMSGASSGLCRRMCQPDSACADGSPCGAFPSAVLIAGREVGICDARVCDPVAPGRNDGVFRPCLSGAYCLPGYLQVPPTPSSQSSCVASAGSGALGGACLTHTDCSSGLGCYTVEQPGECARWCRSDADCPALGSCQLLETAAGQPLQARPGDALGLCVPM